MIRKPKRNILTLEDLVVSGWVPSSYEGDEDLVTVFKRGDFTLEIFKDRGRRTLTLRHEDWEIRIPRADSRPEAIEALGSMRIGCPRGPLPPPLRSWYFKYFRDWARSTLPMKTP